MSDISDLEAWRSDGRNVYAGRSHFRIVAEGYGYPYKVKDFGRKRAVELYVLNVLPKLSQSMQSRIQSANKVMCHCSTNELCHTDELIAECTRP